jgi:hypothetical protein
MFTARVVSAFQTASAAAMVAPQMRALASCMPSKTGLSGVFRPQPVKDGSCEARRTASMYSGR